MKAAWKRRTERFDETNDKIMLIATDAQIKDETDKHYFLDCPYPKVCFTNKKCVRGNFIYLPGFDEETSVGDILRYTDIWGRRIFEKYFDCVEWINTGNVVNNERYLIGM